MENTTNYGLRKPGLTDPALIGDLNYNADIIDGQMKTNADAIQTNADAISENEEAIAENAAAIGENTEAIEGNADAIAALKEKTEGDLAYVAEKTGVNWLLQEGTDAVAGDFIVVNNVLGMATDDITGGSTVIVEDTNWEAVTIGGLNALAKNINKIEIEDNIQLPYTADRDGIISFNVYPQTSNLSYYVLSETSSGGVVSADYRPCGLSTSGTSYMVTGIVKNGYTYDRYNSSNVNRTSPIRVIKF